VHFAVTLQAKIHATLINLQGNRLAMNYLILTSAGLDALLANPIAAGTVVHVNGTLAQADGVARLRAAGAQVHLLARDIAIGDEAGLVSAARALGQQGVVWLESGASAVQQQMSPRRPGETLSRAVRRAGRFLGRNFGAPKSLMIVPYLGYGNAGVLRVSGRVLDERTFQPQGLDDSAWRNAEALYRRLESDQVRGVTVRARFDGMEQETVSDQGGYFHLEMALPEALARGGWHTVDLELPQAGAGAPVRASAQVLVPPPSAQFGVISDIDDTILWTNVTNKINMAMMLARSNPHTRKPFKGVAAFYRALEQGACGNADNPVFYVSSSPWHLFDPLVDFMRLQGIPRGPLMLRELSLRTIFNQQASRAHKLGRIEAIMAAYPALPFVLIGDSGERDPEIYAEILRRRPQSVRAIYIRNVNPDPSRIDALDQLAEQVSESGAQLVLASDSVAAATHAAAAGLIRIEALEQVRADKKKEEAARQ
jgi:phosphatidate phosphatase APP1